MRPKVLIVDDDPAIAELLSMMLAEQGCEPLLADSVEQGLAKIAAEGAPALILLDLMMPVMDGQEFVRRLRAVASAQPEPPIVIISAALDAEERAGAIGARGFLAKPFNLREATALVNTCLKTAPAAAGTSDDDRATCGGTLT